MLTSITQLRALSLTPATRFSIAPAGPSSLQTELVLILTRPAQARTILRIGRSRKHHGKQTRRRKGNNRQFIVHVTHLRFHTATINRKAGPKRLPPGRLGGLGGRSDRADRTIERPPADRPANRPRVARRHATLSSAKPT